jgi:iron complex transport system substrate-binding protein
MIEWIDPLMAGGNWMPELVEMAGAENLFGAKGQPSPWLDWDQERKRFRRCRFLSAALVGAS